MNIELEQPEAPNSSRPTDSSSRSALVAEEKCKEAHHNRSYFGCFNVHPNDFSEKIERPKAPSMQHSFAWRMDDSKSFVMMLSESPPICGPLEKFSPFNRFTPPKLTVF